MRRVPVALGVAPPRHGTALCLHVSAKRVLSRQSPFDVGDHVGDLRTQPAWLRSASDRRRTGGRPDSNTAATVLILGGPVAAIDHQLGAHPER
ncbi:MAG: hypothetical protein ACRDVP_02995, partial [Acidimicrobiales bacterium]